MLPASEERLDDREDAVGGRAGRAGHGSVLGPQRPGMVFVAGTCGNTGSYTVENAFAEAVELDMSSSDAVVGYKAATGANETPSLTHSNVNRNVIIGFVVQGGG